MSLIKYNGIVNDYVPASFNQLIDRFFGESVARTGGSAYSFVPRVDVLEDDKAFEIHVAAPGLNKEDFHIDVNDRLLTVSGERKFSKERNEVHRRVLETQYGKFGRSFTLPENIDATAISAKYNNGILEILIPKDEKKAQAKSIKID